MVGAVSIGDPDTALDAVGPLRRLGNPCADTMAAQPFLHHQAAIDTANPAGRRYYWTSRYVATSTGDLADILTTQAHSLSAPGSLIALFHLGGMITAPPVASCVPFRTAPLIVTYGSQWRMPAEDQHHRTWTRTAAAEIAAYGSGAGYVNFDGDGTAGAARAFDSGTYRRLRMVKRAYDPDNMFRHNVNVVPDDGGPPGRQDEVRHTHASREDTG
jgi:FAD/FMN-containing dehydrogenase